MNKLRSLVMLIFLAVLAGGAAPGAESGSEGTSRGHQPGMTNLGARAEAFSPVSTPVDEARRDASSKGLEEFSGGPAGTVIIGAALAAALVIVLAVIVPW